MTPWTYLQFPPWYLHVFFILGMEKTERFFLGPSPLECVMHHQHLQNYLEKVTGKRACSSHSHMPSMLEAVLLERTKTCKHENPKAWPQEFRKVEKQLALGRAPGIVAGWIWGLPEAAILLRFQCEPNQTSVSQIVMLQRRELWHILEKTYLLMIRDNSSMTIFLPPNLI